MIDMDCKCICNTCLKPLRCGKVPKFSLANSLWIGPVPKELQNLTYIKKLLIARVQHNQCVVHVSGELHKMKANTVLYENPMPKIYNALPPQVEELDEILAFIYTGPARPGPEELERMPMLVRRDKVAHALEWLKYNHIDYSDLKISQENLQAYPENGPLVVILYQKTDDAKNPEATSIHNTGHEDGAREGPCPFSVNSLTRDQYTDLMPDAMKAAALKHLKSNNLKVLAIGHNNVPELLYNNVQLYPCMFPHLFPYGFGGVGCQKRRLRMGEMHHIRRLLMYHNEQFQLDPHFPLIALNHQQIKSSNKGSYIMAR